MLPFVLLRGLVMVHLPKLSGMAVIHPVFGKAIFRISGGPRVKF